MPKLHQTTSAGAMLDAFLTFINQQTWDLTRHKTLIAVSGGIDSVVLMQLFHNAGLQVGIAHCNFGLRGEESDGDEIFVRQLGEKYGFKVYTQLFDTKAYALQNSISTQMAARDLRYSWFEEVRNREGYQWIATAHHANDSIETTLLNLVRGTGLAGLLGVPAQNGHVIRPILFASREEILQYLTENNLTWREDRSNSSDDYKRNKIRHQVIPVLKELNPSLESTFQTTSERLRAAGRLLENFLEKWKAENLIIKNHEIHLEIETVLATPEPGYCLWSVLENYGFNYQQTQQICKTFDALSGKVFYSASHSVLKDRKTLIIKVNRTQAVEQFIIEGKAGTISLNGRTVMWETVANDAGFEFVKDDSVAYFDFEILKWPLKLRNWNNGDTFCPFGMGGKKKKVSDLLTDLKYSVFAKKEVKVLVDNEGEIVWVVGARSDDRFRISKSTRRNLRISLK